MGLGHSSYSERGREDRTLRDCNDIPTDKGDVQQISRLLTDWAPHRIVYLTERYRLDKDRECITEARNKILRD